MQTAVPLPAHLGNAEHVTIQYHSTLINHCNSPDQPK